jgi:hypothetical protein
VSSQGKRLRLLSKETQTAMAEATAVAEDSLGAVRTVRPARYCSPRLFSNLSPDGFKRIHVSAGPHSE